METGLLGKLTLLSVLYVSVAFDTINHDFLFTRLEDLFHLSCGVKKWLT